MVSARIVLHLHVISLAYDAFKNHSQVDVIYTDFKKALYSVSRELLVRVLRDSGFGEPLITWFSSYLYDRFFFFNLYWVGLQCF